MKKDIKFSTRMASADREAIKELAKRSGMSMSDYVTACCLGKQVVVVDGLKEVLKELKSIGRNLNQLVTLAHMGRVTVISGGEKWRSSALLTTSEDRPPDAWEL